MRERASEQPSPVQPGVDELRQAPTHSVAAVLRIRDFRRLWIGLGLSSLGDWMGLLALTALANALRRHLRREELRDRHACSSCGCCRRS